MASKGDTTNLNYAIKYQYVIQMNTLQNEMQRYLQVIERAEADPEVWAKLTEGTGIATANGYRAAIQNAVNADRISTERAKEYQYQVPCSIVCAAAVLMSRAAKALDYWAVKSGNTPNDFLQIDLKKCSAELEAIVSAPNPPSITTSTQS